MSRYDTTFALLRRVGNQAEGTAHWLRQSLGVVVPDWPSYRDRFKELEDEPKPKPKESWHERRHRWAMRLLHMGR